MLKNLELKARLADYQSAVTVARNLGARYRGILHQTDTYFGYGDGRLKMREVPGRRAELIYYVRPNHRRSRLSQYRIVRVSDARMAKRLLRLLLGTAVVVRKQRTLFLFRNARIHLDHVAGLGSFLEFEVLVRHGIGQARKLMSFLRRTFHIPPGNIIGESYSDLLLNHRTHHPRRST